MAKDDGGPAFPNLVDVSERGMLLRDWFAGQALAGIIGKGEFQAFARGAIGSIEGGLAGACYSLADAMLAARNK